ncbi:MAG: bifunctional oligoribonuclease/PAP phosphatase NrnA [Patescibacteria group bacterium]|jgi:phosphoesterase RecJ-like protein
MKQNYSLSKSILKEIKQANNILINVHRNPDLDSIGSATALYQALIKIFGKKATLVCPHEIPENFKFLKGADKVIMIDFSRFDFSQYDLFLIVDSGSYDIVTGSKEVKLPDIKKIIIDHHQTNNWTEFVHKLLDIEASSTAEIVYTMFLDWKIGIDSEMATSLFSGIASDTVFFKYEKNSKKTFRIATELLEKGADKDKLIEQAFDSFDFNLIQTMGEFLTKIKKENGFVYSIMDYKTFVKLGKHRGARETAANLFARSVDGYDFGFIAVEYEKEKFAVSFRSKKNTDVSVIAKKLGGGGHKNAAGATVFGSIDQVIKKIKEAISV